MKKIISAILIITFAWNQVAYAAGELYCLRPISAALQAHKTPQAVAAPDDFSKIVNEIFAPYPKKEIELDWQIQDRIQRASMDVFSFVCLGDKDSRDPSGNFANFLFWCNSAGFHVNPSLNSLPYLDSSGISPAAVDYVIITHCNPNTVGGLLKKVLRRERIKVLTLPEVFDEVTKMANKILGEEFDLREWVDFTSLEMPYLVKLPCGEGVRIGLKKTGSLINLNITYRDKTVTCPLTQEDIVKEGIKMFDVVSVISPSEEEGKEQLKSFLREVSLFSHLDDKDLDEIVRSVSVRFYKPSEVVMLKGDKADACYVVLTGVVEVVEAGKVIHEVEGKRRLLGGQGVWNFYAKDFFGEVGLQSDNPRNASVRAKTCLRLIRIDRDTYNRIIFNPLRGREEFNQAKYALEEFFKRIAPGLYVTEASLDEIILRAKRETLKEEIREGEKGDRAYILLDGRVDVYKKDKEGKDTYIKTLPRYSIFGEMALLTSAARRTATIRPVGEASVLMISKQLLNSIIYKYPGFDRGLREEVIRRIREDRAILAKPRTITIPVYLKEGYQGAPSADEIILDFKSFLKKFNIGFISTKPADIDLPGYVFCLEIIHNILKDIAGENILERGYPERIVITSWEGSREIVYKNQDKTLYIPNEIFSLPQDEFTEAVLRGISRMVVQYLWDEELFDKEKQDIQDALETIKGKVAELKEIFGKLMYICGREEDKDADILSSLFLIYILKSDALRGAIESLRLPPSLRAALKHIYSIYRNVLFLGLEYTQKSITPAVFMPSFAPLSIEKPQAPKRDISQINRILEGILNNALKDYSFYDNVHIQQKFYQPQAYQRAKLDLLRELSKNFIYFNIQKFDANLIEISVYEPDSRTRIVARYKRTRQNKIFIWKAQESSLENQETELIKNLLSPPLNVSLVNLESEKYKGVKGTPENIKTLQAYLEKHRRKDTSVSVFDCQWPENDVDFLLREIETHAPDVLGISATFGCLEELQRLLKALSTLKDKPLIVIGGLMSTWCYDYILQNYPEVICVRYEGEEAFSSLLDPVKNTPGGNVRDFIHKDLEKIPNLAFSDNGAIRITPRRFIDLSKSVAPERLTELQRQVRAGWLLNSEGIGRGCSYDGCTFCTRTHGHFRCFSIQRALADFEAYTRGGAPYVVYIDEDFVPENNFPLVEEFAQTIIEFKEKYRSDYIKMYKKEPQMPSFYVAMRPSAVYKEGDSKGNRKKLEILRLLKKAGLVKIFLGAESGADVQFNLTYRKEGSVAEVEKAIEIIRQEGFQVVTGFITFDPTVSLSGLIQNLSFMRKNGLVYVDPLTEPLNPFKYYRAQTGSVLTRHLGYLGLLSSSQDPDLFMFDAVYRNPLIRLIACAGDSWKGMIADLDFHLKGIIWHAEQSEEQMKKAALFVTLFNELQQQSYLLVEELAKLMDGITIDEDEQIEKFIQGVKDLPIEKLLHELERVLYPHKDIYRQVSGHIKSDMDEVGFDISAFLRVFLKGKLPGDIRRDISQQMLALSALGEIITASEELYRRFLEKRLRILEEFSRSFWKDYYLAYPETMARKSEFEEALLESLSSHREEVGLAKGSIINADKLASPPYKIYWQASLKEFLSYRHPDLTVPLRILIEVLNHFKERGDKKVPQLDEIYIDKDLNIKYEETKGKTDVIAFAKDCLELLFVNGLDVFNNHPYVIREISEAYSAIKEGKQESLDGIILELMALYNDVCMQKRKTIELEDIALHFSDVSLNDSCSLEVADSEKSTDFVIEGKHIPANIGIKIKCDWIRIIEGCIIVKDLEKFKSLLVQIWKAILEKEMPEQERFNLINAIVGLLKDLPDDWQQDLADIIENDISSMTVYLPDKEEYISWQKKYPNVRFIYLHNLIYEKVWPGIEQHLGNIIILAQPDKFDSYQAMLDMVKNKQISPGLAGLIYETFFNRIKPESYARNEDPQEIIRQYTTLALRVMPRKTPVLLLDRNDARVSIFPSRSGKVNKFIEADNGRVRFLIHPQVYHEWKAKGAVPFEKEAFEWALIYPTSSHRTLYVVNNDIVAKTHSHIWSGPAMRRLRTDAVRHSVDISERICSLIDNGELPPDIKDVFAYINESGVILEDDNYYPGGIGVIYRDINAYPEKEATILIPGFSLHNNAVTVEDNRSAETLIQLIEHNVATTGEDRLEFFINKYLRPLYKIFFYFIFKQGILLEPHGQNRFEEINAAGEIMRLIFKDWQSTMVDMETRIRRGLYSRGISKHILGEEAGIPLSLSLVYDHYFGHYLFDKIIDTLTKAYHGNLSEVEFRERLIARFKMVFEEEISVYKEKKDEFPDFWVRHAKKPQWDTSNEIWFTTDGPPEFRLTNFEREILEAIRQRKSRGKIEIALKTVEDETAKVIAAHEITTATLDLERTQLHIKLKDIWCDTRDLPKRKEKVAVDGAYYMVLPDNFDPNREYPVVFFLHGMNSDLKEVLSWTEKMKIKDAVVIIPFGPFMQKEGGFSWFNEGSNKKVLEGKKYSHSHLLEIMDDLKKYLKVSRTAIGGISQGAHIALYCMLKSPHRFDCAFSVNAPFKRQYVEGEEFTAIKKGEKEVFILHLAADDFVGLGHHEEAKSYFKTKGFAVKSHTYPLGAHNQLEVSTAEDISSWLEEKFGSPKRKDTPSLKNQDGNAFLFEIVLDASRPLDLRCTSLKALEKLEFAALSEAMEQVLFLSNVITAKHRLSTIERTIAFLTSHIAHIGKLPSEQFESFYTLISAYRRAHYLFNKYIDKSEIETGKDKLMEAMLQVDYLYKTAMDLQREIVLEQLAPTAQIPEVAKLLFRTGFQRIQTKNFGICQIGIHSHTAKDMIENPDDAPSFFILTPEFLTNLRNFADIEFVLYYNLFIKRGKPTIVIGRRHQIEALKKIAQLSLLGPEKWEEEFAGVDDATKQALQKMCIYYAPKDKQGNIIELDKILQCVVIDEITGEAQLQSADATLTIKYNPHQQTFTLREYSPEEEARYGPVKVEYRCPGPIVDRVPDELVDYVRLKNRPKFGITYIGASQGFDPARDVTNFIIWVNSKAIWVDPSYEALNNMEKLGIQYQDIAYVYLTHIHSDHDGGLLSLILGGKKLKILASSLVFSEFCKKAGEILKEMDADIALSGLVDFVPIDPGVHNQLDIDGVKVNLKSRWNLHSIPANGFVMEVDGYKFGYSSDTEYNPAMIGELCRQGILTEQIREDLLYFFWDKEGKPKVDFLLHEAGGGITHTSFEHLSRLSKEVREIMRVVHLADKAVQNGFSKPPLYTTQTFIPQREEFLLHILASISALADLPMEKRREIIERGEILEVKEQDVIITEGDEVEIVSFNGFQGIKAYHDGKPYFYIHLGGKASVEVEGQEVWEIGYPGWFGEWAIETGEKRTATIRAKTPMTLLRVDYKDYRNIIRTPEFAERIRFMRENIETIEQWVLKLTHIKIPDLTDFVYKVLAVSLEERTFYEGEMLTKEGEEGFEAYIIKEGEVEIIRPGGERVICGPYDIIGEIAIFARDSRRTCTSIALGPVKVLALKKDIFLQIMHNYPPLYWAINRLIAERYGELAKSFLIQPPPDMEESIFRIFIGWKGAEKRTATSSVLKELRQKTIIDLGCGKDSSLVKNLRRIGLQKTTGLDLEVADKAGFGFIQADAARLPFRDKSADIVFANNFFDEEAWEGQYKDINPNFANAKEFFEGVVSEIKRVIKSDGELWFLPCPRLIRHILEKEGFDIKSYKDNVFVATLAGKNFNTSKLTQAGLIDKKTADMINQAA